MTERPHTPDPTLLGRPVNAADGFVLRVWQKTIYLAGTVRTRAEADELIATINALKVTLPEPECLDRARTKDEANG